jgi:hypothetical protein
MATGDKKPARARVVLTDISSRAWEHPADRGALVALRKLKGFDVLLKTMSGVFRERAWRLTMLGSAVRVDERQFARLHRLLAEVGRSLDAADLPEMYVQADPTLNAITVGMDRPIIVLSSGLVHHLDDDGASVSMAAQEAAASYAVAFERTQDTLGRLVHDLAGWVGTANGWLNDRFRRGESA